MFIQKFDRNKRFRWNSKQTISYSPELYDALPQRKKQIKPSKVIDLDETHLYWSLTKFSSDRGKSLQFSN
jgi:hypothetical protein